MRSTYFLVSALAALAAAAEPGTTTISFFGVDQNSNGIDINAYTSTAARVVAIGKYATTYEVACMKGASECALKHPATIVQGPTTYSASIEATVISSGATAIATGVEGCSFTRVSESAVCTWSLAFTAVYEDITTSSSATSTQSIPEYSISYHILTVTDGAYALTADATGSASPVKVTRTASAASTASTASTTSTASTGAAAGGAKPLITAAPLGVAAVAAFAAMF
ncbi:uncharacterized protein N7479_003622 [Penicillium vulpinum]|uniref:Ig-like domain-containing protein n=1 Tax=Penicillium vulpinum TaxID=29845 RepID=A0A1V6RAD6_9EURO|nr:uncharacterized protein N7479_003622 [Penicillium vulpinum]KAJ5963746.1 hypothetical protein N7479_003622 [Penicillium vulpinum]OQD98227.1 hypothetical protein PENVUL_c074G04318 [Penicillium vulpinum]